MTRYIQMSCVLAVAFPLSGCLGFSLLGDTNIQVKGLENLDPLFQRELALTMQSIREARERRSAAKSSEPQQTEELEVIDPAIQNQLEELQKAFKAAADQH